MKYKCAASIPKNLPRFCEIMSKLTTNSRSLKCKWPVLFGISSLETAWNRKAANMLPSAAPMTHAAAKIGTMLVMFVMVMVSVRHIRIAVITLRKKKGTAGYRITYHSTFETKMILLSM